LKRTIWFVSGGIEAVPGIRLARQMGLHVVVSDINPSAPAFACADDRVVADTYDVEASVSAAEDYHRHVRPVDGVLCLAADIPVTVARIAAALGLPGISVESACLSMDKLAMKDRFAANGIAIPWFRPVSSSEELKAVVRERGALLVVKPVDSRGARGVLRLLPDVDIDWAFAFARGFSPTGRVMVEEFLDGPQVSTETIMLEGRAYTPGFSDRNYELLDRYAPHIIENGGDLPSHLPPAQQEAVCQLVEQAALCLGVRNGVIKGDMVVSGGKPYVIELATRLSGGYFCTHEIPLNTGVDFVGAAIRLSLGETLDPALLLPRFQRAVSQRYLFPKPGTVTGISGVEDVQSRPGIELCEIRTSIGQMIGPVLSHPARAGVIIASGDSREEAIGRSVKAVEDIVIETVVP
jgi:biotin carboxylase